MSLILPRLRWQNLRNATNVLNVLKSWDSGIAGPWSVKQKVVADYLEVKEILVGRSSYDTANEGIAESNTVTQMLTGMGFGSPTLNEIDQGVLSGKYTEAGGRRLRSTYLAGRKYATAQSRIGIPEPKTNPAVEREMEAALFRLDSERAHELAIASAGRAGRLAGVLAGRAPTDPRLARELWGLRFPTPIGLAAGP